MKTRETYRDVEITGHQNTWNGRWFASYALPGEERTISPAFAQTPRAAITEAKKNIDRALAQTERRNR